MFSKELQALMVQVHKRLCECGGEGIEKVTIELSKAEVEAILTACEIAWED